MLRLGRPEDGVPEVCCISYTDQDAGCAVFSGPMPEGTRLRMSIIGGSDVGKSAREYLTTLKEWMKRKEAGGYRYDALLCITCVARYFAVIREPGPESATIREECPSLDLAGMYGFSKIGPTLARDDGRASTARSAHQLSCAPCSHTSVTCSRPRGNAARP